MEWVNVASRWIHVGTAIVLVGGAVFQRFVLLPAASGLPQDARDELRARIGARWKLFVMIGIVLFLATGFYNYLAVAAPAHRDDPQRGLYHGLMGMKIILSLVVFFLASALVGRAPALESFRQSAPKWLAVTVLLAAVIVGIAGYLKVRLPAGATPPAPTVPAAAAV